MSSLSEHERIALDDMFLYLADKPAFRDSFIEQRKRLFMSIGQIARKSIPITLSYIKIKSNLGFRKKIMSQERSKRDNFKHFNHFRPKNRDSK
ncbi:MAG TPA: hypothetical protein EYO73_04720 [Sulfurimonas sp.]|nr:hypothetical protein [Sulfurimonas sp.]